MIIDIIIGNPPYQRQDSELNEISKSPIYQDFMIKLHNKARYIDLVIPARWYAGGKGLDELRELMSRNHIIELHDFIDSTEVFKEVHIAGGICYMLYSDKYTGKCKVVNHIKSNIDTAYRELFTDEIIIRDNIASEIVRKVVNRDDFTPFSELVNSRNSFSIPSDYYGLNNPLEGYHKLYSRFETHSYIRKDEFRDPLGILDKYKLIVGKASGDSNNKPDQNGKYLVLSNTSRVIGPGEVCSETYIVIHTSTSKEEMDRLHKYIKTKFFRFLLLQAMTSINISKDKFRFIPVLDSRIDGIFDKILYKQYNLTNSEIEYIESKIK